MRDFDLTCLTPVEPLAAEAIKHIREQSHMSLRLKRIGLMLILAPLWVVVVVSIAAPVLFVLYVLFASVVDFVRLLDTLGLTRS